MKIYSMQVLYDKTLRREAFGAFICYSLCKTTAGDTNTLMIHMISHLILQSFVPLIGISLPSAVNTFDLNGISSSLLQNLFDMNDLVAPVSATNVTNFPSTVHKAVIDSDFFILCLFTFFKFFFLFRLIYIFTSFIKIFFVFTVDKDVLFLRFDLGLHLACVKIS